MGKKRKNKGQKKRKRQKITYFFLGFLSCFVVVFLFHEKMQWDIFPSLTELYEKFSLTTTGLLEQGELQVSFLDVGQGDSILIQSPEGAVLIDGGEPEQGDKILAHLHKRGIIRLNMMIMTHPHADHMGGLQKVVEAVPVDQIIMPKLKKELIPTSGVYLGFMEKVAQKKIPVKEPVHEQKIELGKAKFTFYTLDETQMNEVNDSSILTRLDFGNTSFLFTGDMEKRGESIFLGQNINVNVDVLKVGHHGSDTSSTQDFLKAVEPKYVVIPVGKNNRYRHPSGEVLERLKRFTPNVLRTDHHGTVEFTSDGKKLNLAKEKG